MPRFQKTLSSDQPQLDGMIQMSALEFSVIAGGGITAAITRIALGEWSLNLTGAAVASSVAVSLSHLIRRFGMRDDLQEQFGAGLAVGSEGSAVGWPNTLSTATSAAGSSINVAVLSSVNFAVGQTVVVDTVASTFQETAIISVIPDGTHITFQSLASAHTTPFPLAANIFTTPAGVSGPPPFTGVTEFASVTVPRPKGILIKQITPRYIVNTTNLGAMTIGLTTIQYSNKVAAPTATALLANANNGLVLTAATTPWVIPIPIPVANQAYLTGRNTDAIIEWDVTNAGTGSVDLLGIEVACSFNYN